MVPLVPRSTTSKLSVPALHGDVNCEFGFFPLRFTFRALDPIVFTAGKSANILRGAFGTIFRKLACRPDCPGAKACDIRRQCPYARIFEPTAPPGFPSGLADLPRPFVFRATHLDGQTIAPGVLFHFDLNLFDLSEPAVDYLTLSFAQLVTEGLGPTRGRAELNACTLSTGGDVWKPSAIDLSPPSATVQRITVSFLTPTELKHEQHLAARPEFPILFGRIRDRLSTLSALYGPGPLEIDFKAMGERAAQIRMTRCDLRQSKVTRLSSKTGQRHSIGGFTGEADYEGDLTEFLPYLQAAAHTGVGRQTTWGKGVIRITVAN